jgi:hypothetical protein
VAASQMVPDDIAQVHTATRRLRRIDERRRRSIELKASKDPRGLKARWAEDEPRTPHYCKGKHSLYVLGYLLGPRPDGLDCQRPLRVLCRDCDWATAWACSNHRESKCRPCATRYRRRVASLAAYGMTKKGGHHYFLTLTAPSDVHYYGKSGEVCPCSVPGWDGGRNPHTHKGESGSGESSASGILSELLGVQQGPGRSQMMAAWNAGHSARWNWFRTELRRRFPDLEFFRGIETQKRGALHDHVLIWTSGTLSEKALRELAIRCGFGHEVLCPEIRPGSTRAAYYVSKYITKACDARDDVPWWGERIDYETGEVTEGMIAARYRTWSQSQGWGTSMAAVRAEASVWARVYEDRQSEPAIALLVAQMGAEPLPAMMDGEPPGLR